ncbi:acyl-CoA dehydrogenase family protein [Parerythrobacter aurantius]|uniref:acyl-CoA dehydrogenase family protein n=1 Tax=Parerythrobacter aurantius TaxID=3127706 RepID=UPI00324D1259
MSENRDALCEMAEGLFADLRGQEFDAIAKAVEEAGFGLLLIPADSDGFGGDWGDLAAIMRLAGKHALCWPLGEHVIARKLAFDAGIVTGDLCLIMSGGPVPWGRHGGTFVVPGPDGLLFGKGTVVCGESPAGEPRDRVAIDLVNAVETGIYAAMDQLIAFLRVCQAAGALDAALALSIDHCGQREQFGRKLSQFQAVQQSIAVLAMEAAAVNCAAQGAADALDRHGYSGEAAFEIGAAKLRANAAIARGSALAHQVHGAIGFTQDYPLHELTRRMMGWRSEGGNDALWSRRIGRQAMQWGGSGLWDQLTSRTDPL